MPVRLYAVLRLRTRSKKLPPGLEGERLSIVKCAGCSLAVANVTRAVEPAADHLLEFDRVIRALAAQSHAILPAQFGAVTESAASLRKEIGERAGALAAALDNVAGRVQMTLRIFTTEDSPLRSSSESSVVKVLGGKGAAYLHARSAIARPPAVRKLEELLGDLVRDERIEPAPGGTSVYHLIDRGDVAAYLQRLTDVRASGPFPPYAFVPGIDRAVSPGYDDQTSQSANARSPRPRTHRRSPGNAHR